jgi:hypothetical protein
VILARILERSSWADAFGSRSPLITAFIRSRPETPKMSEATTDSSIRGVLEQLSTLILLRCEGVYQIDAVAGEVPQPPDRRPVARS